MTDETKQTSTDDSDSRTVQAAGLNPDDVLSVSHHGDRVPDSGVIINRGGLTAIVTKGANAHLDPGDAQPVKMVERVR